MVFQTLFPQFTGDKKDEIWSQAASFLPIIPQKSIKKK